MGTTQGDGERHEQGVEWGHPMQSWGSKKAQDPMDTGPAGPGQPEPGYSSHFTPSSPFCCLILEFRQATSKFLRLSTGGEIFFTWKHLCATSWVAHPHRKLRVEEMEEKKKN